MDRKVLVTMVMGGSLLWTAGCVTDGNNYEDAKLVELSFAGPKSSIPRHVPHGCRATVKLKDDRVTDVRYESVPKRVDAYDHCEEIFKNCGQ